jgi:hypothetical protein
VFDSRGLPDYPPPHNAWQFPAPPISPRWKWVAIAAAIVGLVTGSTMLGVMIATGISGIPGVIDNPALITVIERECSQMTAEVEAMPITGSPSRQAATISQQDEVVDRMVAAIREVEPGTIEDDPPTDEWLADWSRLVQARESYAKEILDGSLPDLEIPKDEHGNEIYRRMDDAFINDSVCEVPRALLNPYPEYSSDA